MFDSFKAWRSHELDRHRRQWVCQLCGTVCQDRSDTLTHLKSRHRHDLNDCQIDIIVEASSHYPETIHAKDCPFCDFPEASRQQKPETSSQEARVNARRFMKHVGRHLEQLALFVMPQPEVESDGGLGSNAARVPDPDDMETLSAMSAFDSDPSNRGRAIHTRGTDEADPPSNHGSIDIEYDAQQGQLLQRPGTGSALQQRPETASSSDMVPSATKLDHSSQEHQEVDRGSHKTTPVVSKDDHSGLPVQDITLGLPVSEDGDWAHKYWPIGEPLGGNHGPLVDEVPSEGNGRLLDPVTYHPALPTSSGQDPSVAKGPWLPEDPNFYSIQQQDTCRWQEQDYTPLGRRQYPQPAYTRGNGNLAFQTQILPPRPRSSSEVPTPTIRVTVEEPNTDPQPYGTRAQLEDYVQMLPSPPQDGQIVPNNVVVNETSPSGIEDSEHKRQRMIKRGNPPQAHDGSYYCNFAPECADQYFDRKVEWR